jgi:pyruvate dehydrogenase E2 component (dihydrolipoamide acetyltransferase)
MAIPITIPRLGWNMEEGVFVGWLKPDGATVRVGDALFSLESEKATEDIECLDAGILRIAPDGPREGDKVTVGLVIGYVTAAGETVRFESGPKDERRQGAVEKPAGASTTMEREAGSAETDGWRGSVRPAISPRARRVARELGIDSTGLTGSGRTGRIRERDVRAAAGKEAGVLDQVMSVSATRRTIAKRMLASHRDTAPVTLTATADATNLVQLRNGFRTGVEMVPSYTDFFVKLSALALRKHPKLNSRWEDDRIVPNTDVHIGIAVDTEAGLMVPVIRDVASLNLPQLALRSSELIQRAQRRSLTADEMQGGTFTVTNLGAFGIDAFTPIINQPQCAILGIGRIQRRPAVIGDAIAIRDEVTLSLTFDHRIVDGAPAARFLQTLCWLIEKAAVESPS